MNRIHRMVCSRWSLLALLAVPACGSEKIGRSVELEPAQTVALKVRMAQSAQTVADINAGASQQENAGTSSESESGLPPGTDQLNVGGKIALAWWLVDGQRVIDPLAECEESHGAATCRVSGGPPEVESALFTAGTTDGPLFAAASIVAINGERSGELHYWDGEKLIAEAPDLVVVFLTEDLKPGSLAAQHLGAPLKAGYHLIHVRDNPNPVECPLVYPEPYGSALPYYERCATFRERAVYLLDPVEGGFETAVGLVKGARAPVPPQFGQSEDVSSGPTQ